MRHHIEAVTVCINYGDFLAETIPYNIDCFDRWIIITTKEDHTTRELCRKWSIETLLTNDHQRYGDVFNKGRIIERSLQHMSSTGFRLHLDADIVIPPKFRYSLLSADLDTNKIYGCDRILVKSYEDWQKLQKSNWLSHSYHHLLRFPKGYEVGTRWVSSGPGGVGYTPIGFFQLWHSDSDYYKGVRCRTYPDQHGAAHRSDVQFALKFDRSQRELLPELLVVHLESQESENGANWHGRRSCPFGNNKQTSDNNSNPS